MTEQSGGGLGLPKYQRNENERRWVASKRRTAKLIQSLWKAAEQKLQTDPAFLCLLVQCGWTNAGEKGSESVLRWRNQNIADYLKVPYRSDEQLAQLLSYRFKGLEPLSTSRRNTPLSNSPAPAAMVGVQRAVFALVGLFEFHSTRNLGSTDCGVTRLCPCRHFLC